MKSVLIVNVGSTSFKFQLFDFETLAPLRRGKIQRVFSDNSPLYFDGGPETAIDTANGYPACIDAMMELLKGIDIAAIGFKAVHGGSLTGTVKVDKRAIAALRSMAFIAPAHNPPYVEAMEKFQRMLPEIPQFVLFETAFHGTMPPEACVYAIPYEWVERYGARRYGFHGASHKNVAESLKGVRRVISCHLGGSSSVCAIKDGLSINSGMGFSPQSGLPQANRCGDVDPFLLLSIMKGERMSPEEMAGILAEGSGLKGLSGISGDVRDLEASPSVEARLALDHFVWEVKKAIGSSAALLGGVDVIAFTGGIGENDKLIRDWICEGLEFLKARIEIIPANEERIVAKAVVEFMKELRNG